MRIGSLFCTDCKNIHYDTLEAFQCIKDHFRDDEFVTAEDGCEADLWLLVCGCTNPCIDHDHLNAKFGKLFVMSEHDIPKAIHMIELIKEDKEVIDK